jgi:MFS family permease
MMGPEYYLPLYFQSAKLAQPLQSGLLGLPFVFLEGIGGIISGLLIHRTGRYNALLWAGAMLMTLGFGLLIDLKPSTGLAKIILYQCIGALGSGLLIQPPMIAIQANVSQPHETATATSTLTFMRGLAQAVSIVVGGVVFQGSMDARQSDLRQAGLSQELVAAFSGAEAQVTVARLRAIQDVGQREAVQKAYAWSLGNAWILYAGAAGLAIVASGFVGRHPLSTEHEETRTGLDAKEERAVATQ